METLANLESFARTAEHGSFSEAARRLSLTPAAVSRNVAMLERNLGVRLFHRSTRRLTLTEAGESFQRSIADHLDGLQAAIAGVSTDADQPSGVLKVSLPPTFGVTQILPLLPGFLERYPKVRVEWHFENRQVDLVAEGYDAAIGGGFELAPGLISRALAPAHIVPVASPIYLENHKLPVDPSDLKALNGIVMRSLRSGRTRHWTMRDINGREMHAPLSESIVVNDPNAMQEAALLGLGVAMLATADALPALETGRLVRLIPRWYSDAGAISIYYGSRSLVPAKTRVFVDWVASAFKEKRLAERFAASLV
ncbi:LysR family transcriptional regulator [Rhizobium oryzicola]|uniref:LysR family transcriptional regulator n=1 Tax=Rhizobium oryzicola TaxID=1232668 RepID=A0ABT8SW11_9HYPH|nr:LysR family transcriptional regulator [Rhizobium oryzicola]MDO1582551.1 LysR family transcriptional regulator [Rhizobium oryzicola]